MLMLYNRQETLPGTYHSKPGASVMHTPAHIILKQVARGAGDDDASVFGYTWYILFTDVRGGVVGYGAEATFPGVRVARSTAAHFAMR
jgi:hypothetical protein